MRDPRGPVRKITDVNRPIKDHFENGVLTCRSEGGTLITLDCGHIRTGNQIYTYKIGEESRCLTCGQKADAFDSGKKAYETHVSFWDNPFFTAAGDEEFKPEEKELGKAWADGWASAQMIASMKKFKGEK